MKGRLDKFFQGQWFWAVVGLLVVVAVILGVVWFKQQPKDADYIVSTSQPAAASPQDKSPRSIQPQAAPQSEAAQSGMEYQPADKPADTTKPTAVKSEQQPTATASEPEATCQPGNVDGVVIPSLDVSAKTVPIGLDSQGVLGAPSHEDRKFVGVYTDGPRPGEPGNVLADGHTYIDDSAVFDHDFGVKLKQGDTIQLVSGDCIYTYRVEKMWPSLAKDKRNASEKSPYFAEVIDRENLFRQDGPSGLVVMTCAGEFDYSIRHHEDEAVAYAALVDVTPA